MSDPDKRVLEFLAHRRSPSAKLFAKPVPMRAELEKILASALRVPDHGKLEPWRLVVLTEPDFRILADLAEERAVELGGDGAMIAKGRGQFDRGKLAVAVIFSPKPSEKIPRHEQFLSAGALCLNLVICATAAGWGASWLTGWPSRDPEFRAKALGCAQEERVAGIVHIATSPTPCADRKRPDLTTLVQWGL